MNNIWDVALNIVIALLMLLGLVLTVVYMIDKVLP